MLIDNLCILRVFINWFDFWFSGFQADTIKMWERRGFATFRYTHHLTASFAIDTRNTFIFFTIFVQNMNDFSPLFRGKIVTLWLKIRE